MRDATAHGMDELINPFVGPDPSDETGLNSHFRSTFAPASSMTKTPTSPSSSGTNPFRRQSATAHDYPTPPTSASPRRSKFQEAPFNSSTHSPPSGSASGVRRSTSLRERYPGDKSHRPLDMIRSTEKTAHRSPRLRKKAIPGTDTIDRLDAGPLGGAYHHEGPYDAALHSRNIIPKYSPLEAVKDSNAEALKATPPENIKDALERHHPLEGIASVPPGGSDKFGRTYEYEQGENVAREEGGDYKLWPGKDAAAEEVYAQDREATSSHRHSNSFEMTSRPRNKSVSHVNYTAVDGPEDDGGLNRSNTTGKSSIKRAIGSLRRGNHHV